MKLILFLSLFCFVFGVSAKCEYKYNSQGAKIGWKAFKTPEKAGVGGEFKDFSIMTSKASSIKDLLTQSAFSINTQSVVTGDKGRDGKIENFFFSTMKLGTNITGLVKSADSKSAEVLIRMNGNEKVIKMDYSYEADKLTLTAKIDVLDFGLNSQLKELNKACYALHKGKTWSDVELLIEATVKKSC